MFFQDVQMMQAFQSFIDATYKLIEIGLPTFLMLSEDSNGQSEIVAVAMKTRKVCYG